jgi:pimeloyl-ACP methyl ester carboxylesterase
MNKIILCLFLLNITACQWPANNTVIPVKNGEVNISYSLSGEGDVAVVLMHGWCINKEYWKAQQVYLSKKYKVVALDLGGHGQSGKNRTDWTVEEYARDVMALIKTLQLKKVILVGHSMSGDIMLQVAKEIPEKIIGLIGIDNLKNIGSGFTPEQRKEMDQFYSALSSDYKTTAAAFCRKYLFPPNYPDTGSVNRVVKDVQEMDPGIAIETLQQSDLFFLREASFLSRMKVPLHLIVSDYTPMNKDTVKKYCPKGLFVKTIHGTGHYPMIEQPELFNKLLGETIDEIVRD